MNDNRIRQLLNCRTFYDWYVSNQDQIPEQFRGFRLQNDQVIPSLLQPDNDWMNKLQMCLEYEKSKGSITSKAKTDNGDNVGRWLESHRMAVRGQRNL